MLRLVVASGQNAESVTSGSLYPCYFKMLCQAQDRRPEQDATWGNGYSLFDWCNAVLVLGLAPRRARQIVPIWVVI